MEENKRAGFQIFSGNALKIIAIVTMLMDHIGAGIIEQGILKLTELSDFNVIWESPYLMGWFQIDGILRLVGRIAFPIFCFLLVEGFLHTRDVKKYALRLLAFCFISEIPFDLAFWNSWFNPGYQNVFFTLFFGLLAMIGLKKWWDCKWKQVLVIVGTCGAAMLLHTDYGAFGVIFIILLYLLRDRKTMQTILGCFAVCWEVTAPLAFIPIRMYNGTRGKWNLKYLFYAFYPVHLIILWGIRVIFMG